MNLASKAKAPDFECPEIGWTQQECNEATAKRSRETPNRVRQHFSCTTSCLLAGLGRRLFEDLDEAVPEIDVASVLEADANSPDVLRAAGFACAGNW